jgi:hypothetical protein
VIGTVINASPFFKLPSTSNEENFLSCNCIGIFSPNKFTMGS